LKLTEQQKERYSRHIILEQVGSSGQEKLLSSKVLVLGAGGLGSPVLLYLAAVGIGTIGIIDADKVDLANLQRQIIHQTADIGAEKVKSAQAKIQAINPDVTVKIYPQWANADNIREIISQYDFVIDAADNFGTKFLINDACYFEKKPFCHAGVLRFAGQMMTVLPGETTCCRCLFEPPAAGTVQTCAQAGIFAVVPGVFGLLQATEAIKYLLGTGQLLTDTLLMYDALKMEFRKLKLNRDPKCPLCGADPQISQLHDEKNQ